MDYTNLFIAAKYSILEEVSAPTKHIINPTQTYMYSVNKIQAIHYKYYNSCLGTKLKQKPKTNVALHVQYSVCGTADVNKLKICI